MKITGKRKKNQWKEVKISGQLATDDTIENLEGFIGLEVLENYDNGFVVKGKAGKKRKTKDDKENPKVRKKSKKVESSSSDDYSDEDESAGKFVKLSSDCEMEELMAIDDLEEWQNFGLKEPLLQAIAENGFKKPTEIQSLSLPAALMGRRDILGAAETGSGKTLAFGLPILNGILELQDKEVHNPDVKLRKNVEIVSNRKDRDNLTPPPEELSDEEDGGSVQPRRRLYALILTPTRELAVQVRDHIKAVSVHTGIRTVAIFGGMALVKQERLLRQCPEIVVATPGRFWELLKEGNAHLNKVDDISFLAIDETDRMMEKGHFEELTHLLERINRNVEKKAQRQNFVFSATLTLVHDLPDYIKVKKSMGRARKAQKITPEKKLQTLIEFLGISQPKVVDITKAQGTAEQLTECRIVCSITEKDFYLYYFLQCHPGRTMVFCNSIDCVRRLAHLFSLLHCRALPLHASMAQRQRLKNLDRFRQDPDGLLIATDVAARGLDIPHVQHVIHYQVPRTSENYVHRSGRTARASSEGITILLMEPTEIDNYSRLCRTLGRTEDLPIFPVSQRLLTAVKERVTLAREVDEMDLRERRTQKESGWREKAAEELEVVLTDSDSEQDERRVERKQNHAIEKKHLREKRNQLNKLLGQPLFPKGYSYKYPTSSGHLEMPTFGGKDAVTVMKEAIQSGKESSKVIRKAMKVKKGKTKHKNDEKDKKKEKHKDAPGKFVRKPQ